MPKKPAQHHGVLAVDKPSGWTSRDVVNKLGWLLGEREVGHAGTLDPDATGVLLVTVGEGGKLVRWLQDCTKTYVTEISLGAATVTDDAAGTILATAPVPEDLDSQRIQTILDGWQGWMDQIAPQVSALQQDGVRDHQRVRRGETVIRPPRRVWLDHARVVALSGTGLTVEVSCGAGFYVRSLARDLAVALGTLGHVKSLRRTFSGGFAQTQCVSLAQLVEGGRSACEAALVPLLAAAAGVMPVMDVDDIRALELQQGKTPDAADAPEGAAEVLVTLADLPIAIARVDRDGDTPVFRVVRGFAWRLPSAPTAEIAEVD